MGPAIHLRPMPGASAEIYKQNPVVLAYFCSMDSGLGHVNSEFGVALLYLLGGALFVVLGLFASKLLRPDRPNPEKLSTYECGEDPVGNSRIQLNNRFYVAALIFLVFDVEVIFLFPWATVFADAALIAEAPAWGVLALVEMLIFAGILLLGLAYVWVKGDLDWIRPHPQKPVNPTRIPDEVYDAFNARQQAAADAYSKTL
jgi:NADH-quinone oxidoreductase subunit A